MAARTNQRVLKQASPLLDKVKALCLRRGTNGIRGLSRSFRIMDDNHDLKLSFEEFRCGLQDYGLELSPDEVAMLVKVFDLDSDGFITVTEFLKFLRGGLNERRQRLVHVAFQKIDRDGSGVLDLNDLHGSYDAARHPKVITGEKTVDDVLTEFLNTFDTSSNPDGSVTQSEFDAYYAGHQRCLPRATLQGANLDKTMRECPGTSVTRVCLGTQAKYPYLMETGALDRKSDWA
eukprot:gene10032-431_t